MTMRRLDLRVVAVGIAAAALATGSGCSRDAATGGSIGVTGGTGGGSMGGMAGGGPAVPPEIDGQLVINELMAANVLTAKDENGAAWPWIEILNPTDTDVPLRGYAVTDDFAMPGKGVVADGAVVPAHGYLTLWLDRGASPGATHVAAALNVAGGVVGLARPDGSFIDRLAYGAQEIDLSASREPDGATAWTIEWHVSPGAANPTGSGVTEPAAEDPETVPATTRCRSSRSRSAPPNTNR
jgi:hypothetical protein